LFINHTYHRIRRLCVRLPSAATSLTSRFYSIPIQHKATNNALLIVISQSSIARCRCRRCNQRYTWNVHS